MMYSKSNKKDPIGEGKQSQQKESST